MTPGAPPPGREWDAWYTGERQKPGEWGASGTSRGPGAWKSVWAAQDEHARRDIDARTAAFLQLQADDALLRLRAARRRPIFTMVGAIFSLYVLEVLLANEAVGFMAVSLAGPLNVGLALSLLQCVTTACAVRWYARHARRVLDPEAARVRALLKDWGQA